MPILVMAVAVALFISYANAQLTEPATYTQTPVAGTWQRGYLNGLASGAMIEANVAVMDASGNIYVANARHGISVIDAAMGRVWNLAGMGTRGYKDGPAQSAMFDQGGGGYEYPSLAIDSSGSLYIADGHNHAIRKIFKDPTHGYQWWVSTYTTLTGGPLAVTVDKDGNVWTQDGHGIYKIAPGSTISIGGTVTTYASPKDQNGDTIGTAVNMAADVLGNIYTITRGPYYRIYKVASSGVVTKIAGSVWDQHQSSMCYYDSPTFSQGTIPTAIARNNIWFDTVNIKGYKAAIAGANQIGVGQWEALYIADGPAADAMIFQATALAVTPDGTTVYWGGGDESNLRRLKDGNVMTLYHDGWHINTCIMQGRSSSTDWILGGPLWVTASGTIYLYGNNPRNQLILRKITP